METGNEVCARRGGVAEERPLASILHYLPQGSNSCWGIEYDLGTIHSIHHPVLRVVATIADIYGQFSKLRFKNSMSSVSFHVVGGLAKKSSAIGMVKIAAKRWEVLGAYQKEQFLSDD